MTSATRALALASAAAVGFGAAACRTSTSEVSDRDDARLPSSTVVVDTVRLALGETTRVVPFGLTIAFDTVLSDSRCPVGVTCVWEGSLRAQLTLSENAGSSRVVALETNLEPRDAEFGAARVRLLPDVQPAAGTSGTYRISVVVMRR